MRQGEKYMCRIWLDSSSSCPASGSQWPVNLQEALLLQLLTLPLRFARFGRRPPLASAAARVSAGVRVRRGRQRAANPEDRVALQYQD